MALSIKREPNQVIFEEHLGLRKVILNRPHKLNSLKHEMVCEMFSKLNAYENDSTVNFVILKGNGKAFCAGGDVTASISIVTQGHWRFGATFYRKQLELDYLLGTYKKPIIAIINGIVMGGGAGISMHAMYRVVTDKTTFAMPEASIGLFPDVGASHFLSRLPGYLGEYLGLTGAKLDGYSMVACGLATHFLLSTDISYLETALNLASASTIAEIINRFHQTVILQNAIIYSRLKIINECFSGETVEQILSSLEGVYCKVQEKWVNVAINSMKKASPTSLKLFLRSIREGRKQNLDRCLIREFNVICNLLQRTINDDFFEGSRALLIDKDKSPQWEPSKLELVKEEVLDKLFSTVDDEECQPLKLQPRTGILSRI